MADLESAEGVRKAPIPPIRWFYIRYLNKEGRVMDARHGIFFPVFPGAIPLGLCAALIGCTPYLPPPSPVSPQAVEQAPQAGPLYHRVARGETLWSISSRYGVDLEVLAQVNRIRDRSKIQAGQKLFIPSQEYLQAHPPVLRARRSVRKIASSGRAATSRRTSFGSGQFAWPVRGRIISIFGMKRFGSVNKGVDIQAAEGTHVRAARGGKVTFIHENLPGFGKTVIIDHEDGFASVYAYVSQILVSAGQRVSQKDVIARVGSTGRTRVAALHFEIRRNQKPQNPLDYLP